MKAKKVVGLVERIKIIGKEEIEAFALFDTGANATSIDIKLASRAKLGPIIKTIRVRNPSSKEHTKRPVVEAKLEIMGVRFDAEINIQDRSHMNFPAIIGRNIISGNFIVDPEKNRDLYENKGSSHDIRKWIKI